MNLQDLRKNWESLGESDPFWAVLTDPSKINNQWDKDDFFSTGIDHMKSIFSRLQVDELIDGGHVLDFGCGPGRISQALCTKFDEVTGVDISDAMIEKAKTLNQYPEKCHYFSNHGNDLSQFEDHTFDMVFSYITLQHVEPKYSLTYIKEFIRIAREGGYILFNLPTQPPLIFRVLHALIGSGGINMLRRLYYKKDSVIEMHWVEKSSVIKHVQSQGARVMYAIEDKGLGKGWKSMFYLIKKENSAG